MRRKGFLTIIVSVIVPAGLVVPRVWTTSFRRIYGRILYATPFEPRAYATGNPWR